ncbi:MAG: c-type cytochrome [Gemmatales bacterium]|nr:c-type cytochrome [Gemmatales bacterium]MDW8174841.1 c-type cytochrome [Gemmatales bacterium]
MSRLIQPRCRFTTGCFSAAVVLLTWAWYPSAQPLIAPSEALSPQEQQKRFRLPPGFAMQLVASEPDIQKPINLAFDARGRLWVSHTVEYPFPAAEENTARDGITILEDFGADGRARKITRFADKLNIPIGVLPLGEGRQAIVWSIPHIWKLTDTDGDGRADKREVLAGPFEFVDTHGNQNAFRLGLDGWVYACHGFRNHSRVQLRGQGPVVVEMHSGHTYRFRPDGSAIAIWTHGQVNPFGMCFDRWLNQYTADCHSRPITMLLPGAFYESFGKPHDGLGFGPEMTRHSHGSTGIAGIAYYDAEEFPAEYRDGFFVGNPVTGVVHWDKPTWRGSSPWVEKPVDFVRCEDLWFRPVDLQLGPEGALYVADFYNCIIGHYEVDLRHPRRDRFRGRIWRIVYVGETGSPRLARPRDLTQLNCDELIRELANPNHTVRTWATHQLVERFGIEALPKLQTQAHSPLQQAHAVWVFLRTGQLHQIPLTRIAASESLVQVHYLRALARQETWSAEQRAFVQQCLTASHPMVRRAAAETASLHPDLDLTHSLLAALAVVPDQDVQLRHMLRIALRNHLQLPHSLKTLASRSWSREQLRWLADVAGGVKPDMRIGWILYLLQQSDLEPAAWPPLIRQLAQLGTDADLQQALTSLRKRVGEDADQEQVVLAAMAEGWRLRRAYPKTQAAWINWPAEFTQRVMRQFSAATSTRLALALTWIELLDMQQFWPQTLALWQERQQPVEVREAAGRAAWRLHPAKTRPALQTVLLHGEEPNRLRLWAAEQLIRNWQASDAQLFLTALALAPAELQNQLAQEMAGHPLAATVLLQAVDQGKASPRLFQHPPIIQRLRAHNRSDWNQRIEEWLKQLPSADESIRRTLERRVRSFDPQRADAQRGRAVFGKHCANCHRVGQEGNNIGPKLDGIGNRGVDRLAEDVLDPNRNVDEAYRLTVLLMRDGRTLSGLKLRDQGEHIVFADHQGKEFVVARGDIERMQVSPLSPMPANFHEAIPDSEFADLLAYLRSLR